MKGVREGKDMLLGGTASLAREAGRAPGAVGDAAVAAGDFITSGGNEYGERTMEDDPFLGSLAPAARGIERGGEYIADKLEGGIQDYTAGDLGRRVQVAADITAGVGAAGSMAKAGIRRMRKPPRMSMDEGTDLIRARSAENYGSPLDSDGAGERMADGMEYWGEVGEGVYADPSPTPENLLARERMLARQKELKPAVGTYTDDVSQPPTKGREPLDADLDFENPTWDPEDGWQPGSKADAMEADFQSLDPTLQDMVMNKEISIDEALDLDAIAETKHMVMQEEAEAFAQRQRRLDISKESSPPAMTQQRGLGMDQAFQDLLDQGFDEETALRMLLDG